MQVPSVMFIEMAVDTLKTREAWIVTHELKEFNMLGDPAKKPPESLTDLEYGYLLGLETARVLLATMPGAIKAGVSI